MRIALNPARAMLTASLLGATALLAGCGGDPAPAVTVTTEHSSTTTTAPAAQPPMATTTTTTHSSSTTP